MTAKEARKLMKNSSKLSRNRRRTELINLIKDAALAGEDYIYINFILDQKDLEYFTKLGYHYQPHYENYSMGNRYQSKPMLSWDV